MCLKYSFLSTLAPHSETSLLHPFTIKVYYAIPYTYCRRVGSISGFFCLAPGDENEFGSDSYTGQKVFYNRVETAYNLFAVMFHSLLYVMDWRMSE